MPKKTASPKTCSPLHPTSFRFDQHTKDQLVGLAGKLNVQPVQAIKVALSYTLAAMTVGHFSDKVEIKRLADDVKVRS